MSANMEGGNIRRGKQCPYCDRSFSRSEHLSRHERSHRNERPYQCTSCNASFSRQDTFKRHQSRYHSQPIGNIAQHQDQGNTKADIPRMTRVPNSGIATATGTRDGVEPTSVAQASAFDPADFLLMDNSILDSSISGFGFPLITVPEFGNLTEGTHESLNNNLAMSSFTPPIESAATTPTHPQQTLNPSSWKGSFVISELKHQQLTFEIDMVAPTQVPRDFEAPTRFALERLLNTFAECFLIYVPCIHIPTWKAELAHPCMILAMASIGASYHDDDMASSSLCRIARASIKKYLELTPHTIADQPLWVLQCLLLVMINGSKSANFQNYQEATSLASLLIEGTRYRKCPPCAPESANGENSLLEQWQKWIESEMTRRTICAIYIYLSALAVNFQTANGLCNLDMSDCFLPCEEIEWTSTTPDAWQSNRQSSFRPPVRFSDAMTSLSSSQSTSPLSFSTFGSYVMLHGIVKQLASLHQDVWLMESTPMLVQRFEQALDRWKIWSEQNPEFHISPRYPNGVIAANAISLYRQAHVRLYTSFGLLRSTLATRNVQDLLRSIKDIKITISGSNTCLKAAQCAIEALRTSVKLGLFLTGSISGWHRKLMFNLYSIECCLFLSFWIREQCNRPILDRSAEENNLVRLTQETLTEINLDPVLTTKPYSIQLLYAWALVFQVCNASGLHGIVAEALKMYADGLTE
ncbi:hypothetical protein F5Y04DRAFT_172730 [Hypomontagnella monticulosa]|nr:hypothetical protein F5Y04DRAFT_172730 [Hypomontagnella monticulosa]